MANPSTGPSDPAAEGAEAEPERALLRSWQAWGPLYATAASFICAAAAWYLLKELGGLLRPLVLAVLLCYAILPIYARLRRWMSATLAVALLATVTVALLYGIAFLVYSNVVTLTAELPRLTERGHRIAEHVRVMAQNTLPRWLYQAKAGTPEIETETVRRVNGLMRQVADSAARGLGEAVLVGFYMLFLLLEVRRFPARIREGFSDEHASQLLNIVEATNHKLTDYLRVKAVASLCLAVPQTLILFAFGVKFAVMWGLLAFIGNFIPYLGSLVSLSLPVLLAFLDLEPTSRAVLVTLCLIVNQFVNNNVIEPFMTARAIGLSPLVVLIALSFWGLSWGLIGMLLAVPLTVMLKIVWENVPITRGLARLMEEK